MLCKSSKHTVLKLPEREVEKIPPRTMRKAQTEHCPTCVLRYHIKASTRWVKCNTCSIPRLKRQAHVCSWQTSELKKGRGCCLATVWCKCSSVHEHWKHPLFSPRCKSYPLFPCAVLVELKSSKIRTPSTESMRPSWAMCHRLLLCLKPQE